MIKRIEQSDYAAIKLIVLNNARNTEKNLLKREASNRDYRFYRIYRRIENKLVKLKPNAFENKNITRLLINVPIVKVTPKQKKYSDWIKDNDIEEIKKFQIDVFIRLGFRILRGKILETPKFGVWSYHHGDNNVNRGGPPGVWEVLENNPVTGTILQVLTDDLDSGLVLYRSFSATDSTFINRNLNNFYWKSLSFLPRKLKELHEIGEQKFFANAKKGNEHLNFYSNKLYTTPKNGEFIRLLFKHLLRKANSKLYQLIFFDKRFLMFSLCDQISCSFWRFKKIIPPEDRFWADPHIIYKDHKHYIFIEEFIYRKKIGHISVIVMDKNGNYASPEKVLQRPYHLSHPFVFGWNGNYYMIPSSHSNKTIEIYKCQEFPYKWKFHKTLIEDIVAIDTTLFFYQKKWWLFANIKENDGASAMDELFLFYSDSPLSMNWKPHPQNPIVSDVRKSRPAGNIFEHNENIYRPSQNCTEGYDYGLRINQIVRLSETEYREKEVNSTKPNWDKSINTIHTLNHLNRLTIIDGKLKRFKILH